MGKALQVARTARAKRRWNLTRRSYYHRYRTPLLRNPQSGIYWPGSFPALKQLESLWHPSKTVGSRTVSLSEPPLVRKVLLGGEGTRDSDTWFFAASATATWTSGPYSSPCLFLVEQQHLTGWTQRAWPTSPEPIEKEARMPTPPLDVTQGPRTEASQPRPQSLQWL